MPGFNIGGGGEVNNTVETRRKHRWIFSTVGQDATIGRNVLLLLKNTSRPKFNLEQPELHHDQEVAYFAGKQTWDTIQMEFYDAEQTPNTSQAVWNWIAGSVVAQVPAATVGLPSAYKVNSELQMTDNVGGVNEQWSLKGSWPADSNWNDLDYTNTEIQTVTVTLRFDRAVRVI